MADNVSQHNQEIINKLKEVEIFRVFARNDKVIGKIAKLCKLKTFKKGQVIIEEGEFGDELFIFLNGTIDILKKTLQNEKYTVTTLDADKKSIHVGELALIDNDRRSATVIAQSDCRCLVMKRDAFIAFGNENPDIGLVVTRVIASQISMMLRKATSDVITLFSALVEEISETESADQ
ncbi:MAG TPA: cyclic nucleotide-binding domain-containing protein [Spirochaetota bacterium]|nr:cyclic nucleotide-binding domain-containing protein [Spirochaetota bacterium]HPI89440.1 cyclic nucleotide-binding domain-containing protein [Spirochaetota bacterium]HPR46892.1 cyclic nucleotide-binding domain-containing protein [Spirochaetota bacterium]